MTLLRWFFTDRTTGRVVIGQWPNPPLWVWLAASLVHRFVWDAEPLVWVARAALVFWAVLELTDGVNPFRRTVGALVLLVEVATALT